MVRNVPGMVIYGAAFMTGHEVVGVLVTRWNCRPKESNYNVTGRPEQIECVPGRVLRQSELDGPCTCSL